VIHAGEKKGYKVAISGCSNNKLLGMAIAASLVLLPISFVFYSPKFISLTNLANINRFNPKIMKKNYYQGAGPLHQY
jgi:hypothetical protein